MTELTPIRKVLLVTPPGKLSYPNLIEPREREYPDGSTRTLYSTNLLLPPDAKKSDAWSLITTTILQYAVHELGTKSVTKTKAGGIQPRFKLPGVKEPDGKIEGHEDWWSFYASTGADYPPMLLDRDGGEIEPEESERLIFPGADASAVFGIYFYDSPSYPAGCSFQLNGVTLLGTGEPFTFDAPSKEERHAAITAAVQAAGQSMASLEDKSDDEAPSRTRARARVIDAYDNAKMGGRDDVADFDDDIPF